MVAPIGIPQVAHADAAEINAMNCTIEGCPGEYEYREIIHTVRHEGQLRVIDHVPAEVRRVCGDVLLALRQCGISNA